MASIKDCCIAFPIGDWDLSDVDGIKRRIRDVMDSPDFISCFDDLDVQVKTLQDGPAPRGEGSISCKSDGKKISCKGTLKWRF